MKKIVKLFVFISVFGLLTSLVIVGIYKNGYKQIETSIKQELKENVGSYDEQQIVLKNTTLSQAEELAERFSAKLRITKDGSYATLTLPSGVTINDVVNDVNNEDVINLFSIDYQPQILKNKNESEYLHPLVKPNDSKYKKQTYLNNLNLSDVWNYTKGSGITIAVIDTGIDIEHPEFNGKISEYSYNATEDKIVKDYCDEFGNYDWNLISDEHGHGTSVTGVIAANWNTDGIAGIAPNVNIITIKAECDRKGNFKRGSDLVFGLYYAIEQNVDIVNMSFGTIYDDFSKATKLAADNDIICVAGAGNNGTSMLTYPAADPNVIGVGALAEDSFELANYSNYGENIDIVAPGTVYTTKKGGKYGIESGTSFSAPIVAASIALQLSYDSSYREGSIITFPYVQELLFASSKDLGAKGKDFYFGYGALDVSAYILEERLTVEFDYLTDEIEKTTQTFIKNHSLQNIPEPEKNYAVYDGWYYDIHCLEEYELYMDLWADNLTLYCKWINEDDSVPYTYVVLDDNTIEIRGYTGRRRYITIPEYIEGRIVSSIGFEAFKDEKNLRVINLPNQLKNISDSAFMNCINLTNIYIPDSVTTIGSSAFANNIRLYNINFTSNSNLEIIKTAAFANCGNLVRFDIPEKVKYEPNNSLFTGDVFQGCTNLKQVNSHKNSKFFVSEDGVLYNKSRSTLIVYPANKVGDTFNLPETVDTLGVYSFAFSKIKTINVDKIKDIKAGAFYGSEIENIIIPDTLKSIGTEAFALSKIINIKLGYGLDKISSGTFYQTNCLESITIPKNITEISNYAFQESSLKNITFEEKSKLEILGKYAFAKTNISEFVMPKSVKVVEEAAFFRTNLIKITIPDDSELVSIGEYAFAKTDIEEFNFPKNLVTIKEFAFFETNLNEINLPKMLMNYNPSAFASCKNLMNIYVDDENGFYKDIDGVVYTKDLKTIYAYPAGKSLSSYTILSTVDTIGEYAFYGASRLTYVVLPSDLQVINKFAFSYCSGICSYDLPESLIEIKEYSFSENTNLSKIYIPTNVTYIGENAFCNNYKMTKVTFGNNSRLTRLAYKSFAKCGITSFLVPANVTSIGQNQFEGCENLTIITFEENSKLESIGAYIFANCNNLQEIIFKNGSKLSNVQAHAFEGLSNLKRVDFGDARIINIDNYAFRYNKSLLNVEIPNTVECIGRYAFFGCESLSEITIPQSVEFIGSNAFNLTDEINVYFESNMLPIKLEENWDNGVGGYYVGVEEIFTNDDFELAKLSNNTYAIIKYNGDDEIIDLSLLKYEITQIGSYSFYNKNIKTIILPNGLLSIEKSAFAKTSLEEIRIPNSVKYIGDYAFQDSLIDAVVFENNCNIEKIGTYSFANTSNLLNIIIPKSVKNISSYAFYESGLQQIIFEEGINLETINKSTFQKSNLINVTLPNSITLIDYNAFRDIHTLTSVSFGTSKLIIMNNAFYNTGLTNVNIPENVEYIGEYAFVGLENLEKFNVSPNNAYYASVNGVLFDKELKKLISFPAKLTGSYEIPKNVEIVGFGAFENSHLSNITFEEGINLLTIGYRSFYASDINAIIIPKTVISIDYYAFAMCDKLQTVTFNKDSKLNGIYEGAFYGCINLKNIVIPDEIYEISDYAFCGCLKLEKLPITNNSTLIGIYDYAFAHSGLKEVNLPDSLLDIGSFAFQNIKAKEIIVPNANKEQLYIELGAFNECNELEFIKLPFIGASIDNNEFGWFGYIFGAGSYSSNQEYIPNTLKSVEINEGQTIITNNAFYNISTIDNVYIPKTITSIEYNAFYNSTFEYQFLSPINYIPLEDPQLDDNPKMPMGMHEFGSGIKGKLIVSGVDRISGYSRFYNVLIPNLEEIIILEGCTELENFAFAGCTGLKSITLPNSINKIGDCAFEGCSSLTCIEIPSSVTSIGSYAFFECSSLESIFIPQSVTNIGHSAFYNCSSLESIEIPNSVTSIGSYAFSGCSNLCDLVIPEGVIIIEESVFSGCINLVNIQLPNSVTTIGDYAFLNCSSINTITLSESLVSIGEMAFCGCNNLKEINNGSSLSLEFGTTENGYIAYYAYKIVDKNNNVFYYDDNLKVIILNDEFEFHYVDEEYLLYEYLGNDDVVTLPSNINGKSYRVYNTFAPQNIRFEDGITEIFEKMFDNCTNLVSVEIPSTVVNIGNNAFNNCTNLENIILSENITIISDYAFSNCTSLESFEIPNKVSQIGYRSFYNCINMKNILIPSSVTKIGDQAFDKCHALETINLINNTYYSYENGIIYENVDDKVIFIKSSIEHLEFKSGMQTLPVLSEMLNIKSVVIPYGITEIPPSAFFNCENLEFVEIPSTVVSIGNFAFFGCKNLKQIVIPETVTSIGDSAFRKCIKLNKIEILDNDYLKYINGVLYNQQNNVIHVNPNLKELSFIKEVNEIPILSDYDNLEIVIIPEGIKTLKSNTFENCKNLKTVILPESLEIIGNSAFARCYNLENVEIPSNVIKIGDNAFDNCRSLVNIEIPDSVTDIGSYAFSGCSKLFYVSIPNNLLKISDGMFFSCYSLAIVTLPNLLETIDSYAFWGCNSLVSICIPQNVNSINEHSFEGCSNLIMIENNSNINISIGSIENGQIGLNSYLIVDKDGNKIYNENEQNIDIIYKNDLIFKCINGEYTLFAYTGNEETILLPYMINGNRYLIDDNLNVRNIILEEGWLKIDDSLFNYCHNLEKIVIPNTVQIIEDYAFIGCSNLKNVLIGNGVYEIGRYAFYECIELSNVEIGDAVKIIKECSFSGCNKLENITIPASVNTIEDYSFYNCHNLSNIILENNNLYLGKFVFDETKYLTNSQNWNKNMLINNNVLISVEKDTRYLKIPNNIVSFSQSAFDDCSYLMYLEVPHINNIDLSGCKNLTTLVINKNKGEQLYSAFKREVPITLSKVVLKYIDIQNYYIFENISDIVIMVDAEKNSTLNNEKGDNWNNFNKVYYNDEWVEITFVDNLDYIYIDYYLINEVIRQPIIQKKEIDGFNYKFVGWDINNDGLVDSFPATSNVDITAKAIYEKTINEYTVTYYDKDKETILYQETYSYGSNLIIKESPTKMGYTFICWTGYPEDLIVKQNINIYSLWKHNYNEHNYSIIELIDPTCEEQGYIKHICTICGESYESDYVSALGHKFESLLIEPTCEEQGYTLYTCFCNYSYMDNFVDPLGHKYSEWIVNSEATCTTEGNKYRICECGFIENKIIEKQNHVYTQEIMEYPTCTKNGLVKFKCINCEDEYLENSSKIVHLYERKYSSQELFEQIIKVIIDLLFGYENNMFYYYECMDCGIVKTIEYSSNINTISESMCSHKEKTDKVIIGSVEISYSECDECGVIFNIQENIHTNHQYESELVNPTCTEKGYTIYKCSCGDEYIDNIVPELGHNLVIDNKLDPTCTESGLTEGSHCSRCDYRIVQEVVPAIGHSFEVIVTPPTCEEKGYTTYICHCGKSYNDLYKDALGHDLVVQEQIDPTCMKSGYIVYKCNECDYSKYEELQATGHQFGEQQIIVEATCTTEGKESKTCLVCGHIEEKIINALGHNIVDATPDMELEPDVTKTCTRCDYKEYKESSNETSGCNSFALVLINYLMFGSLFIIFIKRRK